MGSMRTRIDLNADVGEGLGPWPMGHDAELIPLVTSVNIACGAHAGDPLTMRRTVRLAVEAGVVIGAHPGYPDLLGFGRRDLAMAPDELEASILAQVAALRGIVAAEGGVLGHVKPHGALYNRAAVDAATATAVVAGVAALDRTLRIVGPPGSRLLEAATVAGLPGLAEGFVDRAYEADGRLRSRALPGAVHGDTAVVAAQAVGIARDAAVTAVDGSVLPLRVDTLCLHGDTPGAVDLAIAVRAALEASGVEVRPPDG